MNPAEVLKAGFMEHINKEADPGRRFTIQALGSSLFFFASTPFFLAAADGRKAWIDDEWGPRAQGIPSLVDGHILAVLHGKGQAAQIHDEANSRLTGRRTYLQQEMEEKAFELLTLYPEKRSSLGFCSALVNAGILEPAPVITLLENERRHPDLVSLAGINLAIKKQMLMISHADDFIIPLTPQEGLSYLDQGQWVGVQVPEEDGLWFRIGLERIRRNVLVTAFGFPDKEISQSAIQWWYMPHKQGTEPRDELIAARIEEISERILKWRVSNYHFSQRRDDVIRHLVYLDPL